MIYFTIILFVCINSLAFGLFFLTARRAQGFDRLKRPADKRHPKP